jgi:hypothetical protein
MKKFLVRAGWILLILLCLGAIYPAFLIAMELENESQGQSFSDHYIFESKNIFEEYKKGKKDLFSIISLENLSDEELESLPENPPSEWKQQDYLETLYIVHKTILHRPFKEKFRGAIFYVPKCDQVSFGPQHAVLFTSTVNFPNATYYSYDIDLKNGSVSWHGNSYQPIISWPISSVDLSKNKITAEQALQIAEEQGGEGVRIANGNQCEINIDIDANSRHGDWIVSYDSTIDQFTSLLRMEIDANTGQHKVLSRGGAGFYTFDSQQIIKALSKGETDVFESQITQPEDTFNSPPVTWTQEDYYRIAKAFNKVILSEELDEWGIRNISFDLNCDDAAYGPQQMRFSFVRLNILKGDYSVQDININLRTGIIEWSNEYDYEVKRLKLAKWEQEIIDKSWIKIPAEIAMKTVYEEEGQSLHLALKNGGRACQMNGWLDNFSGSEDANSLEWHVGEWKRDYQILGEEDAQLSAFVNVKTGELRFFRFYGNLNP